MHLSVEPLSTMPIQSRMHFFQVITLLFTPDDNADFESPCILFLGDAETE